MQRRNFLKTAGAATAVAAGATIAKADDKKTHQWKMVTTWPKNFPGLGTAANKLAETINTLTDGQIQVKVYGAGELVPALECFDAVSNGTAQMAHGASYYWKGKHEATQFFSAVPFGLTANEMNAWFYYGDGIKLWNELYAKYNLVAFPAGNTGVQMGGWFNKEVKSLADFKGLKMRIPGLGGEVIKRLGGTPVSLPGGEIFTSLKSGVIDATEFVGPYNDLAFGLYKAAKYYYAPGWHEPSTAMECMINKKVFDGLSPRLQALVKQACRIANEDVLAEYNARNAEALITLVEKHGVQLRYFPEDMLKEARKISNEVVAEIAKKDPFTQKVFDSYQAFKKKAVKYTDVTDLSYLKARAEG